jgi:hypothetical protein
MKKILFFSLIFIAYKSQSIYCKSFAPENVNAINYEPLETANVDYSLNSGITTGSSKKRTSRATFTSNSINSLTFDSEWEDPEVKI